MMLKHPQERLPGLDLDGPPQRALPQGQVVGIVPVIETQQPGVQPDEDHRAQGGVLNGSSQDLSRPGRRGSRPGRTGPPPQVRPPALPGG